MSEYIKAPFNFVPLNKKVFFPDWADKISHDIPFSDGESGEIELELTAMTPVFVRNGYTRGDANDSDNGIDTSFSKDNEGKYFIPATSVKGMIRNVMEVMSFGKMTVDKNMKFAQREWDNTDLYDLKKADTQTKIRCGWLSMDDSGGGTIIDCGLPQRINHKRLDEFFRMKDINISFENEFSSNSTKDLNVEVEFSKKKYSRKEAVYKYALLGENNYDNLSGLLFDVDEEYNSQKSNKEFGFTNRRYKVDLKKGKLRGTIVFTGQPNKWRVGKRAARAGKFYEFIFPEPIEKIEYKINSENLNHFKFIYNDSNTWKFFKSKKRIPIFFRIDHKRDAIEDFGLALLYRLPYKKSVFQIVNENQNTNDNKKPDVAECMFGYIDSKRSLKSRVQFLHFKAVGNPVSMDTVYTTLASPKASYYPIYVKQNGKGGKISPCQKANGNNKTYSHYSSNMPELSGWKRYPVKNQIISLPPVSAALSTQFCPLPINTKFSGVIRFHNLKRSELGALLSAITFHNNHNQLFHSIGMGKPLGYGKIKVESVKLKTTDSVQQITPYMIEFEEKLDDFLNENWIQSPQIRELFSMAKGVHGDLNGNLKYMNMSNDRKFNDFENAKEEGKYLQHFSELTRQPFNSKSLYAPIKEERMRIKTNYESKILEAQECCDRKLYPEALSKYKEAAEILPGGHKHQEGICQAEQMIELNRLQEEKKKNEKEEEEKKRREKNELGLSLLNEKFETGYYKVTDFKGLKSRTEQWLKRSNNEKIPENQISNLQEAMERIYNSIVKEKEKQLWADKEKGVWADVIKWTGEETANKMFDQINQ